MTSEKSQGGGSSRQVHGADASDKVNTYARVGECEKGKGEVGLAGVLGSLWDGKFKFRHYIMALNASWHHGGRF